MLTIPTSGFLLLAVVLQKEMKMLILFESKEKAAKKAYKFGCQGSQMGDKWMPYSLHKYNH